MKLTAIILAAGEGKRMKSARPKVLHPLAGRALLGHVLKTCEELGVERSLVVVGYGREAVEEWLGERAQAVLQAEQLGTGHAVMTAGPFLKDGDGPVLVLSGDTPLVTAETLRSVVEGFAESAASAAIVTAKMADSFGYGRIIRGDDDRVARIVEEKDANAEERAVDEVNTGIYCFDRDRLFAALDEIGNDNKQGEYYLTDVIAVLR